jgi:hypothetical protein
MAAQKMDSSKRPFRLLAPLLESSLRLSTTMLFLVFCCEALLLLVQCNCTLLVMINRIVNIIYSVSVCDFFFDTRLTWTARGISAPGYLPRQHRICSSGPLACTLFLQRALTTHHVWDYCIKCFGSILSRKQGFCSGIC